MWSLEAPISFSHPSHHFLLVTSFTQTNAQTGNAQLDFNVDLDDIFSECYYLDLPPAAPQPAPVASASPDALGAPAAAAAPAPAAKRSAGDAGLVASAPKSTKGPKTTAGSADAGGGGGGGTEELTEQQKLERRERNRPTFRSWTRSR